MKLNVDLKVVKLKEDRSLFSLLLLVARSKPNMKMSEAVGNHYISVVPTSMFAPDGNILHCSAKAFCYQIALHCLNRWGAKCSFSK